PMIPAGFPTVKSFPFPDDALSRKTRSTRNPEPLERTMKTHLLLILALSFTAPAFAGDSPTEKCGRLSANARAKGVRTLVIGFEGLASFSAAATEAAYRHQHQLLSGRKAEASSS